MKWLPQVLSKSNVRPLHRAVATVIMVLAGYFAVTGLMIQAVDIGTIVRHAPADSPGMMAIRESLDGPPNFAVIRTSDYAAPALPAHFPFAATALRALALARRGISPNAPLKFVEWRVVDRRPIWQGQFGDQVVRVDPAADTVHIVPPAPPPKPVQSWHATLKSWHRLWALGDRMLWINALVGIGLMIMIASGLRLYFQLLSARHRMGRRGAFWRNGGWLRSLHRGIAIVAAVPLLVVSITGTLLSFDSFAFGIYRSLHRSELVGGFAPPGMVDDQSSPMSADEVPGMLTTTLQAFRRDHPATPIKVLRLRYFAGVPQGVIVTGGADVQQLVYNSHSGRRVGMSGPTYPFAGFPLGWQLHETIKRIHRGDILGLPGRLLDVAAGLSLAFLSISGLLMYVDLLRRRRKAGRKGLFWR